MLKKILKLNDVKQLDKSQQGAINGGSLNYDCRCVYRDYRGMLVMIPSPCNSLCPDGSTPIRNGNQN
ncbi:hypothetical protein IWQ47_005089 [Aquimarina sp. EL_43]|nr:hypothetical protein [Aquimarina sp. EL_35]MBG6152386.1 hypothetical protein [Aquimarina sp. EL_32]MBG6171990.1 hypothetical protein [Aquimarina sp. EL_43]